MYVSKIFQGFYITFNKNIFKSHAIISYPLNELFTDFYWLWAILATLQILEEYLFF